MEVTEAIKGKYQWIRTELLVPAAWNYKESDTEMEDGELTLLNKLVNNIKRNGQVENIIVRELDTGCYEVVNGNHRYEAFKVLDIKEVLCFNVGKISLEEAQRLAIETNETKFKADRVKLAEVLKEMKVKFDTDDFLETMPFTKGELDDFDKLLDFQWGDGEGEPDPGTDNPEHKDNDFKKVTFDLPVQVAEQLLEQVDRFKKILYPDEKPSSVSHVLPIEAMCQILAQTDDKNIIGG